MGERARGVALLLTSAVAFGTAAPLARLAFRAGHTVGTLMLVRFGIAAAVLAILSLATRQPWPDRRRVGGLAFMGFGFYFAQSFGYFTAVRLIPASLATLLAYTFPVFVTLAIAFGYRVRLRPVQVGAMLAVMVGLALTLAPARGSDPKGIAIALGAAVLYTGYILVGHRVLPGSNPFTSTTIVLAGAAASYAVLVLVQGVPVPMNDAALYRTAQLALMTVALIGTFIAGLQKVGPVDAATISAIGPAFTAVFAWIGLGERLGPVQIVGGVILLAAIVVLARAAEEAPRQSAGTPAPATDK